MTKRFANLAFSYAVIAMIFGVFYREFTKFTHFDGQTSLAFLHTHYFVLGMFFFLALMLAEKSFFLFRPEYRQTTDRLPGRAEHHRPWVPAAGLGTGLGYGTQPGDRRRCFRDCRDWAYPDRCKYRCMAAEN